MKKTFKTINIGLTGAFLAISFSGCSSSKFYKADNYSKILKKNNNIALISDSCIKRDEVGEDADYFSISKSKKSATILNSVAKEKLSKKGFIIKHSENNTVCAFLPKPYPNIKIKTNEKNETKEESLPYFHTEIKDKEYKNALLNLLQTSFKTVSKKDDFQKIFFEDKSIVKSLDIVAKKTKQDKLLVILNRGVDVSAGKGIGQAVLTGILTLGMVVYRNVDFLDSYAILIDVKNREVLWTTSKRFKQPNMYDKSWYEDTYYTYILESLGKN